MNERMKELREKAMRLPLLPGCYIMKNAQGEIIYIGKAKVLRNRVSQYFGSQNTHATKVRKMVDNVYDFDYIITSSEFEALILECSLIKQNMPKYNILLKDDKGYSYIKITGDSWRKIQSVKQKVEDGSKYIGPYISSFVVTESVTAAQKIFKLPQCNKTFPCSGNNRRPCLNFHMGQCMAPCSGKVSKADYDAAVDDAIEFLKGGTGTADSKEYIESLNERMNAYAENMEYERAAQMRDRIAAIRRISEKQKVVFDNSENEQVFALARENEKICFNVMTVTDGRLSSSETFFTELDDTLENTRAQMLERYYSINTNTIPSKIVLDGECDDADLITEWLEEVSGHKVKITVPQRGRQFELMKMSKSNAYEKLAQTHKQSKPDAAIIELAEMLALPKPPEFIESYDISHTAGSDPVGAMVVFKNGIPYKNSYRKFIIKEAKGGDDFGSMEEVLTRRFERYIHESAELKEGEKPKGFAILPDLILMDGGLIQVHAANNVLKKLSINVPVFGMVKDDKHRTRAIVSDAGEVAISASGKVFALVTGLQDEVHRFAIDYHHSRHSKNARHTTLTDIPGIGPKKAERLWKEFRTLDAIKRADIETLAKCPGISNADAVSIKKYFNFVDKQ